MKIPKYDSKFRFFRFPNDHSRFWRKVHIQDGCWLWLGEMKKKSQNYTRPYFWFGRPKKTGKPTESWAGAARVMWFLEYGDPGRLWVLHKCDNPVCVNPTHLFLGNVRDNNRDMVEKGRVRGGSRDPVEKHALYFKSLDIIAVARKMKVEKSLPIVEGS